MIKRIMLANIFLLTGITNEAMAGCGSGLGQVVALNTLLNDHMVCYSNGSDWVWQEHHNPNAELWDYKKGASDTIDPSAKVGTWSIDSTNPLDPMVIYDYGSGSAYTFRVYDNLGGTYDFCGAGTTTTDIHNATILTSNGLISCGTP